MWKLYIVRLCVKQIAVATNSYRYSFQERVFLFVNFLSLSPKYELILNGYQERFPISQIPRCEMVYHIFKCFEKNGICRG